MFDFLRRSAPRSPSTRVLDALESGDLPDGTDLSTLGLVEKHGRYAGRKVTYFRLFDLGRSAIDAADGLARSTYADFDARPDLVLCTGHFERDGRVVLLHTPPIRLGVPPSATSLNGPPPTMA